MRMHQQRRAEVRRASFARPHAHAVPTRTGLRVEGHRTSEGTARVRATAREATAACCLQLTARAGGFGLRVACAESSLAAWAQAARSNQRQPALNQRGASRREVRRAEGREGAGDGGLGWFVRNVSNLFGCDGRARDCRCAERPY